MIAINNKKREILSSVISKIDDAKNWLQGVLDDEENCLNNMPENLEGSERYNKLEDAVDALEGAADKLDEAKEDIEEAMK